MRIKSSPSTRVLVRHAGLKKFLSSTGRWTKKAEAACAFPNLVNAIHTCVLRGLKDVELIFRSEDDETERCLRVDVG